MQSSEQEGEGRVSGAVVKGLGKQARKTYKVKRSKMKMFTWDSSVCMSRESVSIMCYRGQTNRSIKRQNAEIKRQILHLHTLQMSFSMRLLTMKHGPGCFGYKSAPLRTKQDLWLTDDGVNHSHIIQQLWSERYTCSFTDTWMIWWHMWICSWMEDI